MSEHATQAAFFDYVRLAKERNRLFCLVFAIPNGAKLPYFKDGKGKRNCPQAVKLLKEGLTPGVWDVFCSVPRGPFSGLYLEFKFRTNKLTKEQIAFETLVQAQGYDTGVYWDAAPAFHRLCEYLCVPAERLGIGI